MRYIRISSLILASVGIFSGQGGLNLNSVRFLKSFATFKRLWEKFHDGLLFVTGGGADAGIGRMVQHWLSVLRNTREVSLVLLLNLLLVNVKEFLVTFGFLLASSRHLIHFLKMSLE